MWALFAPPDDDRALCLTINMSFELVGGFSFYPPCPVVYETILAKYRGRALIPIMEFESI